VPTTSSRANNSKHRTRRRRKTSIRFSHNAPSRDPVKWILILGSCGGRRAGNGDGYREGIQVDQLNIESGILWCGVMGQGLEQRDGDDDVYKVTQPIGQPDDGRVERSWEDR